MIMSTFPGNWGENVGYDVNYVHHYRWAWNSLEERGNKIQRIIILRTKGNKADDNITEILRKMHPYKN